MIRYIKIAMLASIALLFTLVAIGNITDYQTNWQFVSHALSMDTTFRDPALMWRAITQPGIQKAAYNLIIGWQVLTAFVCWLGVIILFRKQKAATKEFNVAKQIGILGLFMGFLLYVVGFIAIGGEWFAMWQSQTWNGQATAGLFSSLIMFVLIFLNQKEEV